ncbi:MAG: DUF1302 domain-containing protein [Parvibaculales bacterium]
MYKSKLRLLSMSALVGAGLVAAGPAAAYELRLGGVDVSVDTTASVGVSVRVADRETKLLPEVNGGPADDKRNVFLSTTNMGTQANTNAACSLNGVLCMAETATVANSNFDSSINADDARLNFDNGDLTGGIFKATSDIEADIGSVRAFARVRAFYDAVLDSDSSFERTGLHDKAESEAVMHLDLLDAYIDYDTEIAGLPMLIRAGKQVINWGESTFVLGGNSVFSPIDVAAIRRPGAEIKEALLPVEALYTSISVSDSLTVEAYVGGHDKFIIDPGGTPFANSDSFNIGSAGNEEYIFIGGGYSSGAGRVNCDASRDDSTTGAAVGASNGIGAFGRDISTFAENASTNKTGADCDNSAIDFRYKLGTDSTKLGGGVAEQERIAYGDLYAIPRADDIVDDAFDDVGLALRWYAENLGSTEFGLYYQKVNSRIPYFSVRSLGPQLGWTTMGTTTDATNRITSSMGCMSTNGGAASAVPGQPNYSAAYTSMTIDDPYDIMGSSLDTTLSGYDWSGNATITALNGSTGNYGSGYNSTANTLARAQEMVCKSWATAFAQGDGTFANNAALMETGAMALAIGFPMEFLAEYPEVETVGASFATTLLGWGVQGEIAYREEMPLQVDTDSVVIAGVGGGCAFLNYGAGGDAVINANFGVEAPISTFFTKLSTFNAEYGTDCSDEETLHSGYATEEVFNWDIGTTATYSRSNPVVAALGADLAILLTEIAGVVAPDYEDHGFIGAKDKLRAANVCTSGSDLGLKGLFNLDTRESSECRATSSAWGYVLFGQLQYNNVFGTAWGLKPTVVYSAGAEGMALRPAASWVEDQGRMGLSLTADKGSSGVSATLAYTDYFGDVIYNRDIDRDTLSVSVVYGF